MIGDAFLLTWKIDDKIADTADASALADQALIALLKTMVEIIRNEDFICNFSNTATSKLYKRFPNYNVRIGCGLHYGWAIEGAIGSNRKIDASYLSPNVNFTEYLESSTKLYNVSLLMSEPFYKMLSPIASRLCRQVDRIRRHEGDVPMGLYTYDCDLSINFADHARKRLHHKYEKKTKGAEAIPPKLLRLARGDAMGGTMKSLFRSVMYTLCIYVCVLVYYTPVYLYNMQLYTHLNTITLKVTKINILCIHIIPIYYTRILYLHYTSYTILYYYLHSIILYNLYTI